MTDAAMRLEPAACALCGADDAEALATGRDYEYWTSTQAFTMVRCRACAHVYLNPRPVRAEAARMYPAGYYTRAGRHTARGSRLVAAMKRRVIRNRLRAFEDLFRGEPAILEIGCGDGELLLDLKRRCPAARVTGIDLAKPPALAEPDAPGVAFIEGAVEDVELPEAAFDLVIMNQLVEHVWDPNGVMAKVARCLRPGGRVSIETINLDGWDRRFFPGGAWGGYYFPRHLNLFTFGSLARLADKHGLEVAAQHSLVAPIVWVFSLHAVQCPSPGRRGRMADRFLTDRNPVALGLFTAIDLAARTLGATTSNQKTVLRKAGPVRR